MSTVDFTGTVSEGTVLARDLVPAFMDVLAHYAPDAHYRIRSEIVKSAGVSYLVIDDDHEWWDSEDCGWILNEDIWDAMNEIAPDGCYFGAHPGDGADYGFWQAEEDY